MKIFDSFKNLYKYREMICALAVRDLKSKYIGTLGGIFWIFATPLATVIIFYFVFAVGFKATGPREVPFIIWFVCGLVPWLFFNGSLIAITNSIVGNMPLVKKTIFPTEILAFTYLLSESFIHLIFFLILCVMLFMFQIKFEISRFLFVYYFVCMVALLLGLGWVLSALQIFYRDIAQGLGIFLNLLFWATPIVWSADILPLEYARWVTYNPISYIVEGYRDALVFSQVRLPDLYTTIYYWVFTLTFLFVGNYLFRKLKTEFADVS